MKLRISKPRRWYNEFKSAVRWKEYCSFYIVDFPIFAVRKYDWMDNESSSWIVALLGISINIWDLPWH